MGQDGLMEQLLDTPWVIIDDALPTTILDALREEALTEYREGEFRAAQVGKGIEKQRIQEVRSDKVRWLERTEATLAQHAYWEMMDQLRMQLSGFFRVHLERVELHFAVYPIGAFYAPHLDQFREQSNRIFSVITYLNPDWKPGDGGELRIHLPQGDHLDIQPLHGRMICFRSDVVMHEVLEAHAPRISLTGWMRRDPLIY